MSDYSGDVLGVTYSSLHDAATAIRKQAGELERNLEELKALVKTASADWHGEAHEAYAKTQNDWDIRAQSIKTSLDQIAKAVDGAGPAYRAGDRKAASHFH
ncbi:WXG100 family type VII secretion target [Streptomyces sp. NPDC048361]|uniref:WXG100 family type VII secretion target n=1 Tax=Streptomyces sp. NPDC048361 TaxID=3154720 RepID=UPI00343EE418